MHNLELMIAPAALLRLNLYAKGMQRTPENLAADIVETELRKFFDKRPDDPAQRELGLTHLSV